MGLSEEYIWIPVFATIFAFIMAFGIGANDVANAFATSVGAKTLTLRQAVMIAAVCEFLGAVTLGARVTDTVKDDITLVDQYENDPETLMFIMMCSLLGAGSWLLIATYFGLPVSTTHSIIGSIAGGALAAKGQDAVGWDVLGKIALSWIISPLLSGVFAFIAFLTVRHLIMRHDNAARRAYFAFPVLAFAVFCINTFFIMYKGSPDLELDETPLDVAIGVAFGIGGGAGIIAYLVARYYLLDRMSVPEDEYLFQGKPGETAISGVADKPSSPNANPQPSGSWISQGVSQDIHEHTETDHAVKAIHENTEVFDHNAERMFSYMQVLTAIFDSFAHGANDVANSVGPLAACIEIYRSAEADSEADVEIWILVLGAVGIVAGLALYGYKVMAAIGVRLTKITPSRGFSIELSSALVVIIASRYELPVSTTHCQVGATLGVGVANSFKSVNWFLLLDVVVSWITTLVFSSFVTGLIVAFGYYSPSYF